jgi:DNA-3-methyladenine glycosylase II
VFEPAAIKKGLRFLSKNDVILAGVIKSVGVFTLAPDPGGYEILVRSILSQQISVAAARTIRGRLQAMLPGGKLQAKSIDALSDEQLQSVGVSRQKSTYLRHLTLCTLDGTINFRRIAKASDEDAIEELVQIKGIGRWTAQMFLMFSLGRIDVFAPDDLGLRNAIHKLYEPPEKLTRTGLEEHAEMWRPYRTIASWYLWRSLEQKSVRKSNRKLPPPI